MANPTITFAVKVASDGRPFLSVELESQGIDNNDIRMRFARLAMRYAKQMADASPLAVSGVGEGDRVSATLTFSQAEVYGDGEPFIDYDEEDEIESFYNYPEDEGIVLNEKSIGYRLQVSHLGNADQRPLGWAVSPAVVAARTVGDMVRTAIEQAAGVQFPERSGDLDGLGL